jgi:mono/diheme cytochrome c family protein
LIVVIVMTSACRQDMHDQPKYIPLRESTFFNDARSARPVIAGTVARGQLRDDELMYTGKVQGQDATVFPMRVDAQVMARGQERFDIYCSPCHSVAGDGDGMVVRRGFPAPPSFHIARLRNAPDAHFYAVITHGYGAMYSYGDRVIPQDRWAIVEYIRALQLTRNAGLEDVPIELRGQLESSR